MKTINEYLISYKHPKRRKLHYMTILAENEKEMLSKAPKEANNGCLLYGVHSVEAVK